MHYRKSVKQPFKIQPPAKIIIDTHGGLQDILAIVFAHNLIKRLGTGQQIIGITCVAGKNSLDVAVKSALAANKLLGTHIPVYRGQSETLMLGKEYPKTYMEQKFAHVEQKLYSQVDQDHQLQKIIEKQSAVDFLIGACKKHHKNLGIVSFGPVTNLGLAQRLEESLKQIALLSLTGGQVLGMGNTVKGNVQANFAFDPLAARILFEVHQNGDCLQDKIYVNPIENTLSFCFKQAINSCLDTNKLDSQIDEIFVNMMGINSIVLNCGPILTVLPIIAPKSVTHHHYVYAEIVQDAGQLDGLLAINWLKADEIEKYKDFVYVYENYDKEFVTELFLTAFVDPKKASSANL